MSESGFPRFPGRNPPGQATPVANSGPRTIRLDSIPQEILALKLAKIEARVEQIAQDGKVILSTPAGNVEVTVRDPRVLAQLREGQQVQIEIPPSPVAGQPPRTVDLILDPPKTSEPVPTRPTGTPVEIVIQVPEDSATSLPVTTPVVPGTEFPETPVRLEPLSVEQVARYVAQLDQAVILTVLPDLEPALRTFLETVVLQSAPLTAVPVDADEVLAEPLPIVTNAPQSLTETPVKQFAPQTIAEIPQIRQEIIQTPDQVSQTTPVASDKVFVPPISPLGTVPVAVNPISVLPATKEIPNLITTPSYTKAALTPMPVAPSLPAEQVFPQITGAVITAVYPAPVFAEREGLPNLKAAIDKITDTAFISNVQQAGQKNAVVIAQTPQHLPVIFIPQADEHPSQFFVLHTPLPQAVPGTQIILSNISVSEPSASSPQTQSSILPPLPMLPFSFMTAEPWPLMTQIYQNLSQAVPQAAQAFVGSLPSPASPAQIMPAALFFIAALRSGDIQGWLGQKNADILRRVGQGGLLSRLGQEASLINRGSSDPAGQDWRAIALPFYKDNEIHKMTLHYKHDRDAQKDGPEGLKQTRFVFDLSMHAMGAVQVDGLFRPGRLDVILRAEQNFSQDMQAEMRRIYADALRQTEITGELSFQTRAQGWVTVVPNQKNSSVQA